MIIPVYKELTALRGGTYDRDFKFWADVEETVPYPLTGIAEIDFAIDGLVTLTLGNGLTVDPVDSNVLHVVVASTVTDVDPQSFRYRVKFSDGATPPYVQFPVKGRFIVEEA